MDSTVKIVRPADLQPADANGVITVPTENLVVYQGKARIHGIDPGGITQVGDISYDTRSTSISIPWNANTPDVDDIIEVTTCPSDFDVVGRSFRITGVSGGGLSRAVRLLNASVLDEGHSWQS